MSPLAYAFTPAFADAARLADYYYRTAWYLKQDLMRGATVYFVAPGLTRPTAVPEVLAPDLAETAADFEHQLKLVGSADQIPATDRGRVRWLCHDATAQPARRSVLQRIRDRGKRPLIIDHARFQFASSAWLKATSNNGEGTAEQLREARARFAAIAKACTAKRAFLFGTGPSFDKVDLAALPPGLRIATNSMVANPDVLEQLKPDIIVASDPIFHAGPSRYAYEFRHKLVSAIERYDAKFIFPMRDVGVYTAHLPAHIQHQLIPVPLTSPGQINYRMSESLSTATTGNVMTLLLLPVAASLTKELVLGGFDGRSLEANDYFWQHSSTVQINSEMASIQQAHPAFFAIDYDDYYLTHIDVVRRYLDTLETNGYRICCLTDSHVPALKSRFDSDLDLLNIQPSPDVSVIMPNYNSGVFIDDAIRSVRDQRQVDYELLVIDDGSTDESLEIARRHAREDSKVRIIEQDHAGVSAARNLGLLAARGRYCAFLDSDDRLTGPDSLSSRVRLLRDAADDVIVAGDVALRTEDDKPLNADISVPSAVAFGTPNFCSLNINGVMARRGVLRQARFPAGVSYGEDCAYVQDLLRRGYRILPIRGTVATYRMSAASATQSRMRDHVLGVIDLLHGLGQDRLNSVYPAPNRAGAAADVIARQIDCRYAQLIVHLILNDAPAKDICAMLDSRLRQRRSLRSCSGNIERTAMRAMRLPRGSSELRNAVKLRSAAIHRAVAAQMEPYERLDPLRQQILIFLRVCEAHGGNRYERIAAYAAFGYSETRRRGSRFLVRLLTGFRQ